LFATVVLECSYQKSRLKSGILRDFARITQLRLFTQLLRLFMDPQTNIMMAIISTCNAAGAHERREGASN
jgi:hypothetical protein